MIFGIGTDIVRVPRMAASLSRHGERFAARILTANELAEFRLIPQQAHFLAKRFAAKEAVVKALGTGFRDGLSLHDIGVGHDELGKPLLEFSAKLQARLQSGGVGIAHLSLSDEQDHALAFVILEKV